MKPVWDPARFLLPAIFAGFAGSLLMLSGCGSRVPAMAPADAPPGWAEELQAAREAKDHRWAMAEDAPIHPEDRTDFKGLEYFPPDPAYRFVGPIQLYPDPARFTILTTTGKPRPAERYGEVRFPLKEKTWVLQVYRLLDSEAPSPVEALFLPFTDKTSGVETYPAGRYVDFQEAGDGLYLLDFNLAHNPYCAYGMPERYACPVTPSENHLPIRIEAGEKGYRHHGGGEQASE